MNNLLRRKVVISLFLFFSFLSANSAQEKEAESGQEDKERNNFFLDSSFEKGFTVVDEGKKQGVLSFRESGEVSPWWTLAEHCSKYDITKVSLSHTEANTWEYHDPGKLLQIHQTPQGERILRLQVHGDKEYDRPRTKASDPWIHLLLSKNFSKKEQAKLNGPNPLLFSADLRVVHCDNKMKPEEYDKRLHCGQTTVYFIFQNLNRKSKDYGDYLWFGIYIYDSRYQIPETRMMIDGSTKVGQGEKRGTGKLIYVPGGQAALDEFYQGKNPVDFDWVHVEANLSKYVQEALSAAQKKGFLTKTSLSELKIGHFNLGWEVTGTFDCALDIKNLKLYYDTH